MLKFIKNLFKKNSDPQISYSDEDFENPNLILVDVRKDGSHSKYIGLENKPKKKKEIYERVKASGKDILLIKEKDFKC